MTSADPLRNQTLMLFAGLGVVLLVASGIGLALKWRIGFGTPHATIDNLNARIKSWWLLIAVIGGAIAIGKTGTVVLFGFASMLALREFVTISPTRRGDHKALLMAFAVVLPAQYLLVWIEWYGMFTILIPVYAFLFLPIISAL